MISSCRSQSLSSDLGHCVISTAGARTGTQKYMHPCSRKRSFPVLVQLSLVLLRLCLQALSGSRAYKCVHLFHAVNGLRHVSPVVGLSYFWACEQENRIECINARDVFFWTLQSRLASRAPRNCRPARGDQKSLHFVRGFVTAPRF